MKLRFLKKAAAFVTAVAMSFGTLAVLPESVLPQLGIVASAEEIIESGQCGDNAFWKLDSNGLLVISGEGEISSRSFENNASITAVSITEGITGIGNDAFSGCCNMTELKMSDSVITLGNRAVVGCDKLKSVIFSNNLKTIGSSVFDNCRSIQSLVLPNSVTSVGDRAFWWCTSLKSISLSSNMTVIGASAFEYCQSLSNITIPNGITTIKEGAFSDCDSLLKVILPSTVNSIGDGAFKYCDNLGMVCFPESIINLGANVFYQSNNVICYGMSNSIIQTYCKNNGYKFVELEEDIINISDMVVHITSVNDWIKMSNHNAQYNGYEDITISIDNDLDFTGVSYVPLGDKIAPFKGNIEGNGHNISNLKVIASSDYLTYGGLIGYAEVDCDVFIKDLNIFDYNYNTYQDQEAYGAVLIAGLTIKEGSTLTIENLSLKGTGWAQSKSGNGFYGNVIGTVEAHSNTNINISNVATEVRHDGYSMSYGVDAGIVGHYEGTDLSSKISISRCHVKDDILAFSFFGYCSADGGGIIGALKKGNATITECCVNGKLRTKSYYTHIGGIVGNVQSSLITIKDCLVNPKDTFEKNNVSILAECTNGQAAMGGFIGCIGDSAGSSINNSFFSSTVSAGVKAGFASWCGENQLIVNNSYFDIETTGIAKNDRINDTSWIFSNWVDTGFNNSYGITAKQMANQSTYLNWDFDNVWTMTDDGYPQLKWVVDGNNSSGYIKLSPLNDDGISVGGSESILAYVYDKDDNRLSNVNLVWTSSDENVVAITDGNNLGAVVEGKSAGEATITCTDTVSGCVGELNVVVSKYEISYNSQKQNKTLAFDYSDSYFDEDATVFNQKLAQSSLALELSSWTTYDEEDVWTSNDEGRRKDNLQSAFQVLGFENDEYTKYNVALSDNSDTVAFGIAQKSIIDGGGNESTIVAVAVRGGGYGGEWASNFRIGDNKKYASGFWDSSTGVYNYVNDYINKYAIEKDKLKIWIVGFSRGAAVANLTAARLCNNYSYKNIYAYTFATPQGYIFNNDEVSSEINYHNIHNIINPADLVPTVALSGWGFGRFGESHYINYGNRQYVKTLYYRERKEEYCVDPKLKTGVIAVDDFLLNILTSTPAEYSTKLQPIIVSLLAGGFASGDMLSGGYDFDEYNFHSFFIELILEYSKLNNIEMSAEIDDVTKVPMVKIISYIKNLDKDERTIYGFTELLNGEMFSQHYGETYIAWLFSSDTTDIYYDFPFSYKTAIIDCPVDVYVYDDNDTLVASIINNEILCDDITVSVFGEQKRIYFNSNTSYKIKLIGNDTGEMDYCIEERNSDGKVIRRVNYYDLSLENGKTYSGMVNDEVNTPSYNYDLTSDDGTHSSDFDSTDSVGSQHSIIINGGFSNIPSAYPGEQVTISALVPNNHSVFSKWVTTSSIDLDNNELPVATFIMPNADVEVTAVNSDTSSKLSNIMVDSTAIDDFSADNTDYTVTLPYGTTAIPTVTATPANANANVDITQATSLTGTETERTAIITVTAEDGVTKTIYKVVFSIETHTHNLATEYSSDETGHWYECSDCDDKVDFETHTEDGGTVTTEPTETTEGVRTFKCTKCDWVIRTEPIAVLDHTHTLATDYSSDATGHWYTCSGCDEKVAFEAHTEDGGTVTTAPTETTEGIKTFKCTKCGWIIRTEVIPPISPEHTHSYGAEWKSDSTSHWHECSCGEKAEMTAHISDNGVVTVQPTETTVGVMTYSCSVCGYILKAETIPAIQPEHTHNYGTEWKSDIVSHWHECSCGDKTDIAQHISNGGTVTVQPTAYSTGLRTYSCTVCGYVIRTESIPATGMPNYPAYPSYPTYPTYPAYTPSSSSANTASPKLTVKAETMGKTVILSWNEIPNVDSYIIYQLKNGKYVKVKTTTDTSVTFKNLTNGKTYKFMVRYTMNGRICSTGIEGRVTVKVYYKPITKTAAGRKRIKLSWAEVPNAEKYVIYKYVDGKAVKLTETTKLSVIIKGLKPDTEYKYIVRAYVDGKWIDMKISDIVTVKTKA